MPIQALNLYLVVINDMKGESSTPFLKLSKCLEIIPGDSGIKLVIYGVCWESTSSRFDEPKSG